MKTAQVHRFRALVAASMGSGETCYLTPAEARKVARALNKAAKDCKDRRFSESIVGTFELKIDGRKEQGCD